MFFARYADAILGAVLTATTTFLLAVLIPLGVQLPKSNKILALSPDFWMKIIVWSTLVLGLVILYRGIVHARREPGPDELAAIEEELRHYHPLGRAISRAATAVVGLIVYFFLIDWIGIVAASVMAIIGFVLLCGERRWKIFLPLATLLPVALYYFFLKVASIPMPLGIFN